jgi:hypothetical protein
VPERLAGLEHVDDLVLVEQLDRPAAITLKALAGGPSSTRITSPAS